MFTLGLALTFLHAGLAQASEQTAPIDEAWPTVPPSAVLSTPDWSDYRIYPEAARSREYEGVVGAELWVGSDGVPQTCRTFQTSFHSELDAGTCALMMTMRFAPARDESGKPIASRFAKRIAWLLADRRPFASSTIKALVRLENGRLADCKILEGNGIFLPMWSTFACSVFADTPYFFPAGHETGSRMIEIRLDANDGLPFLRGPWTVGTISARERLTFAVDKRGVAINCTPVERFGFGPRGLNNLSVCGRLLSSLWFKKPRKPQPAAGVLETRVYLVADDAR